MIPDLHSKNLFQYEFFLTKLWRNFLISPKKILNAKKTQNNNTNFVNETIDV